MNYSAIKTCLFFPLHTPIRFQILYKSYRKDAIEENKSYLKYKRRYAILDCFSRTTLEKFVTVISRSMRLKFGIQKYVIA